MSVLNANQSEHLSLLVQAVNAALHDPANNARTLLLVLLAAGALLMVVLLTVYVIVTLVQDWRRPPAAVAVRLLTPEQVRRSAIRKSVAWLVVALVLFGGAVFGYAYGTSDAACARCHYTKKAFASRATGSHPKVACSSCHVAPGPAGAFVAVSSGVANLATQVSSGDTSTTAEAHVKGEACLTCHQGVTSGVVTAGGIRMRHADVLGIGYECTDCHPSVGHTAAAPSPRKAMMAQCVQCHDGKKARSECSTCHSRDVGTSSATRTNVADMPKAPITPDGCRGCHTMKTCIDCHGLELPHSEQFKNGFHARKALLEPQTCVKCHSIKTFCNGCHQFGVSSSGLPTSPHGSVSSFVQMHRGTGPMNADSASCSCHTSGAPRRDFCAKCHTKQPDR